MTKPAGAVTRSNRTKLRRPCPRKFLNTAYAHACERLVPLLCHVACTLTTNNDCTNNVYLSYLVWISCVHCWLSVGCPSMPPNCHIATPPFACLAPLACCDVAGKTCHATLWILSWAQHHKNEHAFPTTHPPSSLDPPRTRFLCAVTQLDISQ